MNNQFDDEDPTDRIPLIYTIAIILSCWLAIFGIVLALAGGEK